MVQNTSLGARLKAEREKLGLTLEQIAEKMGFDSYQTISSIESGKREVKAWELAKLANIYHQDFNYFLEEDVTSQPEPIIIWRDQKVKNKTVEQHFIHFCENYEKLEKMSGKKDGSFQPVKWTQEQKERFISSPSSGIKDLALEYLDKLKLGSRPACLLPKILEETQGVKLFYTNNASGSAASTISDMFGAAILLNSKNVPWRRNYDLAHELFHLITWNIFNTTKDYTSEAETWAEMFGAAILMPEKEIRDEFNKRLTNNKISASDLVELAVDFEVSINALLIRLEELGLLRKKDAKIMRENYYELRTIDKGKRSSEEDENKPRLSNRFINLAIKAFLLGKISKGKLAEYLEIPFGEVSMFLQKRGYDENKDYTREFTAT
jgi:Zn-dependent peptidase ImmA (M78 family)/DNA-binding XRE family transcriptional regulator